MKTAREIAQEFIDEQGPHLKGSIELLRQFGTYIRERDNRDISAKVRHAAGEIALMTAPRPEYGYDEWKDKLEAILKRHLEGK